MFCRLYGIDTKLNDPIAAVSALVAPRPVEVDLEVMFQALPVGANIGAERQHWFGKPNLVSTLIGGDSFASFCYPDDCEFVVERHGLEIWASWPSRFSVDFVLPYLLGPVMGFTLRFRGITCLHASAVSVDGRAVVMVGSAGAGKSTTAAAFACLGFSVLSDDIAPLYERHGGFEVEPGYPRICLWPNSVQALFGSPDALPLITEGWEKRYLSLQGPDYHFNSGALPLGAVYILGERSEGPFEVSFSNLGKSEALLELIANTYSNYLPLPNMCGRDMQLFSRLLSRVPVRQVTFRDDVVRVKDLASAIADDFIRNVPNFRAAG